jgi:hypothetical protein
MSDLSQFKELAEPLDAFWAATLKQFETLLISSLEGLANQLSTIGPYYLATDEERQLAQLLLDSWQHLAVKFGYQIYPESLFTLNESAEVARAIVFRPDDPAGSLIRWKQFGLAKGEELIQPAKCSISAGPAPVGFTELEQAIGDEPTLADLAQQLKGWRLASLEGAIEQAAIEFYLLFWTAPRSELLKELVMVVMQEGFLFVPFYPNRYQDHEPEALQIVGSNRMLTGRVRELFRPGLFDRDGGLRVPARVAVE